MELRSAIAMSIDMSEILPEISNRDWGAENWVFCWGKSEHQQKEDASLMRT
jgi:hypothetical protein